MNPLSVIQNWLLKATPEKKRKALLIGLGGTATLALFILTGGSDAAGDPAAPDALFYVGVFVKLAAVLLLIVGGAVIFQRWNGSRGLRKGTGRQLRLVETIRLTPRQAVHVVEVAGRHFLIGATDQSISILSPVDLPQEAEIPAAQANPILDFGDLFTNLVKAPHAGNK